jgi:hypothetical protein
VPENHHLLSPSQASLCLVQQGLARGKGPSYSFLCRFDDDWVFSSCPTECRLSFSNTPWKCVVSIRFITDANGQPLGQARNELFGPTIYNKAEVEERIRRAQRAILNPSTPYRQFLGDDDPDSDARELTFSNNCVSLQISGKDVADLSFCDLPGKCDLGKYVSSTIDSLHPGLIASVGKDGNNSDIEMVKNLVTSYISKPSCLILSTVACESRYNFDPRDEPNQ